MDQPCCVDHVERINQLEAEITSLKKTVTNLQTQNNTWASFFFNDVEELARGLNQAISKGNQPTYRPQHRPWSIENTWTTQDISYEYSTTVADKLFIPLLFMIRYGRLHTNDFIATMNQLTKIISSSREANTAAIQWLLHACNDRLDRAENKDVPAKTVVWALADVLVTRWPEPQTIDYRAPLLFTQAVEIDQDHRRENEVRQREDRARQREKQARQREKQARQEEVLPRRRIEQARQGMQDPRRAYMLRVKVAPQRTEAFFVKDPSSPFGVLLWADEKKCAFVDQELLPPGKQGTLRVAGPGNQFFELDLD